MFKFKSTARDNIVYVIDKSDVYSGFFNNPSSYISSNVFEYDTMGDEDIQHTPLTNTISENTLDFLISMAEALIKEGKIPNITVEFLIFDYKREDKKNIEFLNKLEYDEEKIVYYNYSECKKSKAESKRYDKRWKEVPPWFKGSLQDIFTLMQENSPETGFLRVLNRIFNIQKTLYFGFTVGADFFDMDYDRYTKLTRALRIFRSILRSYSEMEYAIKSLEQLKESRS
jgi:hypothetical protein